MDPPGGEERRLVAVFGSSEPPPGHPLYEAARKVGRRLAASGFGVLNGGYGGVMEGASRGAVEVGGVAVGVPCALFSGRSPNPYLSEVRFAPDLYVRTRRLIEPACGYIILRGRSGTLAEVAFLWALNRAGALDRRPVVLLGEPWPRLLRDLVETDILEPRQLDATVLASTPEEAVDTLTGRLDAQREG